MIKRGMFPVYAFGQQLEQDAHFFDHMECEVPVQIYLEECHKDIGYIEAVSHFFVKINNTFYNRDIYKFVSRPGY